jgi:hypothetical protein
MSIEDTIHELYRIKRKISNLKDREKELKRQVHIFMNDTLTNRIDTDYITCNRNIRSSRRMIKSNVPEDVWDEFSEEIYFPALTLRRL